MGHKFECSKINTFVMPVLLGGHVSMVSVKQSKEA